MLEIKPDGETKSGCESRLGISFEMPAREMCLERRAVLARLDGQSEYMTFAIDFMPDVIWIDGRKFKYGGVSDGRGFYREEPRNADEARAVAICKHLGAPVDLRPLPDSPFELRSEDLVRQTIDATAVFGPYDDTDNASAEWKSGVGFFHSGPGASVESHIPAENANPNLRMQCSRCSEVLDLVSQMIENPPGLSGIHSPFGHIGNQYVDAGWVEALTRVKSYLVTGSPGTRVEI